MICHQLQCRSNSWYLEETFGFKVRFSFYIFFRIWVFWLLWGLYGKVCLMHFCILGEISSVSITDI